MNSVSVIMSTYNGEKYIEKQIESIIKQKNVKVSCLIRDDGSNDSTIKIIKELQKKYTNITLLEGKNIGWEKSFLYALQASPKADYYAFSDQDDIWFDNKLINGINHFSTSLLNIPTMYHCNKVTVDEQLKPLAHQIKRLPCPLNRKNAMIQEYAQGCSIIINNAARNLVLQKIPHTKIAHDFWIGMICFLFGKVIYDPTPQFYHISHGTNASCEGSLKKSWQARLKKYFSHSNVYYAPVQDLLNCPSYNSLLSQEDKSFIKKIISYKSNIWDKLSLLISPQFRRASFLGTLSLKISILLNKL